MKGRCGAKQVLLSAEQLEHGLAALTEEVVPWWTVAIVAKEPEDFERVCGIMFSDTFDNLDYLKVAVLDLPSGVRVALKRYRGAPTPGTDLSVGERHLHDYQPLVEEVMEVFQLHRDDIIWSRPHDI